MGVTRMSGNDKDYYIALLNKSALKFEEYGSDVYFEFFNFDVSTGSVKYFYMINDYKIHEPASMMIDDLIRCLKLVSKTIITIDSLFFIGETE